MRTLYVPGTEETDLKKIIMALQQTSSLVAIARETLTAARIYYVATTGSNSNDGKSSAAPFLTIQKAIDTVSTLDLVIYNITISCAAGTYTGGVIVSGPWLGSGTVTILGDATTPANCIISTTSADCVLVTGIASGVIVSGFRFTTTTSGNGLYAVNGGLIRVAGKCEFVSISATGEAMRAEALGIISLETSAFNLSGSLGISLFFAQSGTITNTVAITFTWLANTTATIFAFCSAQGRLDMSSCTFAVGAFGNTGKRYAVANLGFINTAGGGINYFPGTIAGTGTDTSVTPWGLYQ